jgi:hypothetical protein
MVMTRTRNIFFKEVELLLIEVPIISHKIFGLLFDFFNNELTGDCALDLTEGSDSFAYEVSRGVFLVLKLDVKRRLVFSRS